MRKAPFFAFLAVICLTTSPLFAKDGSSLQIKGSDTMVNLVQAWAETFMAQKPGAFIAVTGGGSGTGLSSIISGSCDIAMSSRNIKQKEIDLAGQKGIYPKEYKVALDGLAVVVHPSNPVSQLTLDQLAGIFTGKIKNWKKAGGKDARIVLLSREVNSGTHVYFKEHVLRKGDAASREEFSPEALLLSSSQAIADEVAQNPDAIGYYGMGYLSDRQKAVSVASAPGGKVAAPTIENVLSGHYPISRPLFFYTRGEPTGDVKEFVEFVLSSEGQAVVSEQDFVPISK